MDYEQIKAYQQQLLLKTLLEAHKRSNEQIRIWSEYKKGHEKVIEGLQMLPKEVSVNSMVPVGKKALMRGKLTHTNEILVCLGDGYFAKYSAPQAISLCNRRIKKANEMLESLDKEKNLIEMRQMVPDSFDLFENDYRSDLVEHWDDKKLKEWRDEHRQKEKEYRKKIIDLKKEKKVDIQTEEDLFKRLDALELQEELEDELTRLEEQNPDFYNDMEEDEYIDESEVDSESYSSDYSEEAITEVQEKKSTKLNHRLQVLNGVNLSEELSNHEKQKSESSSSPKSQSKSIINQTSNCTSINGIENDSPEINLRDADHTNNTEVNKRIEKLEVKEKKVVFAQPQVKYFSNDEEIDEGKQKRRVSFIEQKLYEYSKEDDESEDESDQDDIIRIYFKHSDTKATVPVTSGNQITNPRDIYKLMPGLKSILKKRPDDATFSQESLNPVEHVSEDSDAQGEPVSTYDTIVKEITEHKPIHSEMVINVVDEEQPKRPISKFKLQRAEHKK